MKRRTKRRLGKIFLTILIVYLSGGLVLYLLQDKILFHPKPVSKNYKFPFDQDFEELNLPFQSKNINIVEFRSKDSSKGVVLFFHGNMENVAHYKSYPAFFLRNHYDVWMVDYPGFGKTTGKRTEKIMYEQALQMYEMAFQKFTSNQIIIYGKSIGTGVAAYIASIKNCKRLILETPYYSIPSLARHYFPIYPTSQMIRYSFPIYQYLAKNKNPTSLIHGTDDEIIPYRQSLKLKEKNRTIELITINGGEHNNLSQFSLFQKKIDSLLTN